MCQPRLFDQMRGDEAIDDAQHQSHDRRANSDTFRVPLTQLLAIFELYKKRGIEEWLKAGTKVLSREKGGMIRCCG
jgi:hypothetical protein